MRRMMTATADDRKRPAHADSSRMSFLSLTIGSTTGVCRVELT